MSVIGLRAGPYEIVAPAAIPGSRQWFVARRKAAIRTVPPRALLRIAGVQAMEELRAQYNVLRTIQDPRIPTAIGLYEDVGALATTLVSGKPLHDAIGGRRTDELHMTPATLLDVLMELSEALARAHGRQCHHGHLDPDHVWMTEIGSLWVLGFGESREAPRSTRWQAPEHARGTSVGAWTDQWSLAALGTALITGQAIWAGPNPEQRAREGDVSSALTVVAQQWPALARVFHKMFDADPGRRFSNMAAVRQELAYLARQAGNASDRRTLGAWLATRPARREAPLPALVEEDFEASTMVIEQPQRILPHSFAMASSGGPAGLEPDSEPTAMTDVFHDGHVQLAEALLTEPGDDPSLVGRRAVDPDALLEFEHTMPMQRELHAQAMLLDEGVTEVDVGGPTSSLPHDDLGMVRPPQSHNGQAVTLWLFVLATLLVLCVFAIWMLASLVGLPGLP